MSKLSRSKFTLAFSLIELLSVISVISIMAVAVAPAISNLAGASGSTRAVTEVSNIVEHARQSAMQMSTWVWIGIADTTELNSGEQQLSMVELASRDGSLNTSESNLMVLSRPAHVKYVKSLTATQSDATVLGSVAGDFSLKWTIPTASGTKSVDFSDKVIGFSPRGEAVITSKAVPAWIKVSFVTGGSESEAISVLVSGPSGQVVVAR